MAKAKQDNTKTTTQTIQCKVLWVTQTSFAISFKGYGVSIQKESNVEINEPYVTVEYTSDIGEPDFVYNVIFTK